MKQLFNCTIFRFTVFLAFLLFNQNAFSQATDIVTNQTVIKLQKAGISNDIITTKINNTPCNFDLSVDGIIALKKDSVSDDIIKVMIARGSTVAAPAPVVAAPTQTVSAPVVATVPVKTAAEPTTVANPALKDAKAAELQLSPGLYYYNATTGEYVELEGTALVKSTESVSGKVTGFFNGKTKGVLHGRESNTVIAPGKALFVFVFDAGNNSKTSAPNPNDYFLVQFEAGTSDRALLVRKTAADGFERGIDDTAKLPFHYKRIQKGLYEITTSSPLPTGEFGFMMPSATPDQFNTYQVYDFSAQ